MQLPMNTMRLLVDGCFLLCVATFTIAQTIQVHGHVMANKLTEPEVEIRDGAKLSTLPVEINNLKDEIISRVIRNSGDDTAAQYRSDSSRNRKDDISFDARGYDGSKATVTPVQTEPTQTTPRRSPDTSEYRNKNSTSPSAVGSEAPHILCDVDASGVSAGFNCTSGLRSSAYGDESSFPSEEETETGWNVYFNNTGGIAVVEKRKNEEPKIDYSDDGDDIFNDNDNHHSEQHNHDNDNDNDDEVEDYPQEIDGGSPSLGQIDPQPEFSSSASETAVSKNDYKYLDDDDDVDDGKDNDDDDYHDDDDDDHYEGPAGGNDGKGNEDVVMKEIEAAAETEEHVHISAIDGRQHNNTVTVGDVVETRFDYDYYSSPEKQQPQHNDHYQNAPQEDYDLDVKIDDEDTRNSDPNIGPERGFSGSMLPRSPPVSLRWLSRGEMNTVAVYSWLAVAIAVLVVVAVLVRYRHEIVDAMHYLRSTHKRDRRVATDEINNLLSHAQV